MMNWSDQNENLTATTQDDSLWTFRPFSKECFYIALGLQWINVILIVSLNIAVIVTIMRAHKKSRLYFLLMNMAIADLMTGFMDAFVNAIERTMGLPYIDFWWFGDDALCKFQRWFSSVCLCASNFILAATSFDRALVVAKPMLSFKRGYVLQKILIIACWVLSAAVNSPIFFVIGRIVYKSPFFIDRPEIPECTLTDFFEETVHLFFTIYVLLPLVVIMASYTVLIYAIYKRANSPPNSPIRGVNNLKIAMVFNKGLPKSKARSIKLAFGIVLSFLISWTPFCLLLYTDIMGPVRIIFVTFFYWNCVANPVVFFVFHRRRCPPPSRFDSETPASRTFISLDNTNMSVRNLEDSEAKPMK